MFNKKEMASKELKRLEMIINEGMKMMNKKLSIRDEFALSRIIEEVGVIAKILNEIGVKNVKSPIWNMAIKTRDKISHIYSNVDVAHLIIALKDFDKLLSDLPNIKKEINKMLK